MGDREHCMNCGMDDYLAKPFDREQLHALLARWLKPGRQATMAQAPANLAVAVGGN